MSLQAIASPRHAALASAHDHAGRAASTPVARCRANTAAVSVASIRLSKCAAPAPAKTTAGFHAYHAAKRCRSAPPMRRSRSTTVARSARTKTILNRSTDPGDCAVAGTTRASAAKTISVAGG